MWVVYATLFGSLALVTERLAVRHFTSRLHARGQLLRRTLVVGTNSEAASVVHALNTRRLDGFQPLGCLASSLKDRLSLDYTAPVLPTLGTARDLTRVILEHEIDTVVLVASAFDHEVLERIIAELADARVDVYLSSSLADVLLSRVTVREVAGIPLISLRRISLSPANLFVKRVFDLVGALAIILAGLPLWLAVAAVIKLTSPGPVFYRQRRVGLRGRPFRMYKFRTMVDGADGQLAKVQQERNVGAGPLFKLRDDPRITPVGKWMRRFSVDEFPQLLNVVRGEMSLVGPRPPLPDETLYYDECQWRRLEVVPGMTGLWQVSGRSRLTFEEMVELDLFYIGNWRLALDLSILARTVPAVLTAQGAW
jgi:exopolysaccharide biosynthesis polyprenyl glycosylphosphotransferase